MMEFLNIAKYKETITRQTKQLEESARREEDYQRRLDEAAHREQDYQRRLEEASHREQDYQRQLYSAAYVEEDYRRRLEEDVHREAIRANIRFTDPSVDTTITDSLISKSSIDSAIMDVIGDLNPIPYDTIERDWDSLSEDEQRLTRIKQYLMRWIDWSFIREDNIISECVELEDAPIGDIVTCSIMALRGDGFEDHIKRKAIANLYNLRDIFGFDEEFNSGRVERIHYPQAERILLGLEERDPIDSNNDNETTTDEAHSEHKNNVAQDVPIEKCKHIRTLKSILNRRRIIK